METSGSAHAPPVPTSPRPKRRMGSWKDNPHIPHARLPGEELDLFDLRERFSAFSSSLPPSVPPLRPRPRTPSASPMQSPLLNQRRVFRAASVSAPSGVEYRANKSATLPPALLRPLPTVPLPLSLDEFVKMQSKSLPLRILVQSGFCGDSERLTLSAGDLLNVHFVKRAKVVTLNHLSLAQPFNIPLNSSVKFSLLHDPNGNVEEAMNGIIYNKVSDLTALETLPKVVCVTKAWKGKDKESSVEMEEILVIIKVCSGKKGLKVFSLNFNTTKKLPCECKGRFTTKPETVSMYLLEINNHVPKPFPCKAVFSNVDDIFLRHLASGVVTLLKQGIETTLVASNILDECQGFIDIPVDLPGVTVSILESKHEQRQDLYHTTRQLVDQFDPSIIKSFGRTPSNHDLMCKTARKGYERVGVDFDVSSDIYEVIPAVEYLNPSNKQWDDSDNTEQQPSEIASLKKDLADMKQALEQLKKEKEDDQYVQCTSVSRKGPGYSVEEIGALLEAKGLKQYREAFEKECIDGEILQELDDEILEKDLGVASKLHRIRIMKLVTEVSTQAPTPILK